MTIEDKKGGESGIVGDGFDGYDIVAGDGRQTHQGPIQGEFVLLTPAAGWETVHGGQVLDSGKALIVIDGHLQPFPNEAAPPAERRQGTNGLRGPWPQRQYVTMLDPATMDVYTFATATVDGFAAIRQLVDEVKATRKGRAEMLSPVVRLGDVTTKTLGGDRRRAFFHIIGWIRPGGGDPEPAVPPAPLTAGPYEMEAPDPDGDGPEELSF